MSIQIETISRPLNEQELAILWPLYLKVFGGPEKSAEELGERIARLPPLTSLFAFNDHRKLVGFKLGYGKSKDEFYSWLGGVDPEHRRQGIAEGLMQAQYDFAKKNAYKFISTKTFNKWRSMLIMNLKHGFDIVGFQADDVYGEPAIFLRKRID